MIESMYKHLSFRNYSKHTVGNYVKEMNHICCYYGCSPKDLNHQQIQDYLYHLVSKKNFGPNKIAVAVASFAYFYHNIAKTPEKIMLLRSPRIPSRVPFVLSSQQVYQFIESLPTLRAKVIVQMLYSTGIRVGECVGLKRQDIHPSRMMIRIVKGKGQKDRYVPLSPMMLSQLERYYKQYDPENYIFYGRRREEPMNRITVNRIIGKANFILKTEEKITPHTFRHSFATMLTEEGESLFTIQKILGHKSINSTFRYIKASKTKLKSCINPLDKLYEDSSLLCESNQIQ